MKYPELSLEMARKVCDGGRLSDREIQYLIDWPEEEFFDLLPGANLIRRHFWGNGIHLCAISNGKSGRCPEDCAFCAQSIHFSTNAPVYGLKPTDELVKDAEVYVGTPVNRFSIVASGRRVSSRTIDRVAETYGKLESSQLSYCASLGVADEDDLRRLKAAGVSRYHHNLETARSHFPNICTTHTYDERVETIEAAKRVGLQVCSGGIFGMGETDAQVVELALELKRLRVDSVPVNFLVPVEGTPMAGAQSITPQRCLKVTAMLRFILGGPEILIGGGRADNLKHLHSLVFMAGASGTLTGNYLTRTGEQLDRDLAMLTELGLAPRGECERPTEP